MSAMKLLKIAAIGVDLFFRAGRGWPKDGITIPATDLTEADLDRIRAEPRLHVAEIDGDADTEISDEDLRQLVATAIGELDADAFGQDGKPKLPALRSAIPDHKDRITTEMRDEVWARLQKTAPAGQ